MGRPAGSQNKNKNGLLKQIQEEFPNYHPVMEMVRVANDTEAPAADRFAANKEVAQYVTPKLKAVEVSGADGKDLAFNAVIGFK